MSEKKMKIMKRSLALALALVLAIGAGSWMKDSRLKADEEAPEAEVVVEEAAPTEASAPAGEPAPAEEPVVVVQEVELQAEAPAVEPVAEEPASEPTAEPTVEPVEEEPMAEEVAEEKAPFDVREAYEYYMSLGSEAEKLAYLESLDPADRAALERYIADMEAAVSAAEAEKTEPAEAAEEVESVEPEVRKSTLLLAYEDYLNMSEEARAEYLEGLTEKERVRFDKLSELVGAEASFTVRFFDYEGVQIGEAQTVKAGTSAIAPAAPSKEGVEFTGWNADFSCVLSDLDVSPRTDDKEKSREVIISYAGGRSVFAIGEQVTIVSELIGFDDAESIGYQWQYSQDAEAWNDAVGGNGTEYSFIQTMETGTYFWRLLVNA